MEGGGVLHGPRLKPFLESFEGERRKGHCGLAIETGAQGGLGRGGPPETRGIPAGGSPSVTKGLINPWRNSFSPCSNLNLLTT